MMVRYIWLYLITLGVVVFEPMDVGCERWPSRAWMVVRDLPGQKYSLKEGDTVNLGRFRLKVKQLVTDASSASEYLDSFGRQSNGAPLVDICVADCKDGPIFQEAKPNSGFSCRICLSDEVDHPDDPLIAPCTCRGTIQYIHANCLKHWIELKQNSIVNQTQQQQQHLNHSSGETLLPLDYHLVRQPACELCKSILPDYVRVAAPKEDLDLDESLLHDGDTCQNKIVDKEGVNEAEDAEHESSCANTCDDVCITNNATMNLRINNNVIDNFNENTDNISSVNLLHLHETPGDNGDTDAASHTALTCLTYPLTRVGHCPSNTAQANISLEEALLQSPPAVPLQAVPASLHDERDMDTENSLPHLPMPANDINLLPPAGASVPLLASSIGLTAATPSASFAPALAESSSPTPPSQQVFSRPSVETATLNPLTYHIGPANSNSIPEISPVSTHMPPTAVHHASNGFLQSPTVSTPFMNVDAYNHFNAPPPPLLTTPSLCELKEVPETDKSPVRRIFLREPPTVAAPFVVLENLLGVSLADQLATQNGANIPLNQNIRHVLHVIGLGDTKRKTVKLGRGHESDIRIPDVSISRVHACLSAQYEDSFENEFNENDANHAGDVDMDLEDTVNAADAEQNEDVESIASSSTSTALPSPLLPPSVRSAVVKKGSKRGKVKIVLEDNGSKFGTLVQLNGGFATFMIPPEFLEETKRSLVIAPSAANQLNNDNNSSTSKKEVAESRSTDGKKTIAEINLTGSDKFNEGKTADEVGLIFPPASFREKIALLQNEASSNSWHLSHPCEPLTSSFSLQIGRTLLTCSSTSISQPPPTDSQFAGASFLAVSPVSLNSAAISSESTTINNSAASQGIIMLQRDSIRIPFIVTPQSNLTLANGSNNNNNPPPQASSPELQSPTIPEAASVTANSADNFAPSLPPYRGVLSNLATLMNTHQYNSIPSLLFTDPSNNTVVTNDQASNNSRFYEGGLNSYPIWIGANSTSSSLHRLDNQHYISQHPLPPFHLAVPDNSTSQVGFGRGDSSVVEHATAAVDGLALSRQVRGDVSGDVSLEQQVSHQPLEPSSFSSPALTNNNISSSLIDNANHNNINNGNNNNSFINNTATDLLSPFLLNFESSNLNNISSNSSSNNNLPSFPIRFPFSSSSSSAPPLFNNNNNNPTFPIAFQLQQQQQSSANRMNGHIFNQVGISPSSSQEIGRLPSDNSSSIAIESFSSQNSQNNNNNNNININNNAVMAMMMRFSRNSSHIPSSNASNSASSAPVPATSGEPDERTRPSSILQSAAAGFSSMLQSLSSANPLQLSSPTMNLQLDQSLISLSSGEHGRSSMPLSDPSPIASRPLHDNHHATTSLLDTRPFISAGGPRQLDILTQTDFANPVLMIDHAVSNMSAQANESSSIVSSPGCITNVAPALSSNPHIHSALSVSRFSARNSSFNSNQSLNVASSTNNEQQQQEHTVASNGHSGVPIGDLSSTPANLQEASVFSSSTWPVSSFVQVSSIVGSIPPSVFSWGRDTSVAAANAMDVNALASNSLLHAAVDRSIISSGGSDARVTEDAETDGINVGETA